MKTKMVSRHFSQGIDLMAVSGAKHAGRGINRLEVGLATGSQVRGAAHRRSRLGLRHSSAIPIPVFVWKSCLVAVETLSIAVRRRPERKSASTDRWS
jgi:hypothetical protein